MSITAASRVDLILERGSLILGTSGSMPSMSQVQDYAKAAQLVKEDSADGMLTDYPICLATLRDHPDAGFVSLSSLLTYEPIGVALPTGDAQFINWTESFLDRMRGTNGIEEFGRRWFGKLKLVR